MAIFWESQRSNIIPINCGGAQMFFFLLFVKFFVCLFLIWSRGVGVVGVLLIAFIWLPKPKLHFSKILPSHNYILKIEYKYLSHKKSFGEISTLCTVHFQLNSYQEYAFWSEMVPEAFRYMFLYIFPRLSSKMALWGFPLHTAARLDQNSPLSKWTVMFCCIGELSTEEKDKK